MRYLSIDIETFSPVDIRTGGMYKYAERSEIILFAYSFDFGPVEIVDLSDWWEKLDSASLAGYDMDKIELLPEEVRNALVSPEFIKTAHNAPFEIENISKFFHIQLYPEQWRCSAVLAANAGYPLSLDDASKALGTAEKKDARGKALIKYFCVPCKPTKSNGFRERNLPEHDPEKWQEFKEYCIQDVVTEQAISQQLGWIKIPEHEHKLWQLDYEINRRGVQIDKELANCAIKLDIESREKLLEEARSITGLDNPNSVAQLKAWLAGELKNYDYLPDYTREINEPVNSEWVGPGDPAVYSPNGKKEIITEKIPESLSKDNVKKLLGDIDEGAAKRVLEIRLELAKSSVKKYTAMLNGVCSDGRIRGLVQFYGANRTGRWAGRLVQVQNLPRISYDNTELDLLRNMVFRGDGEAIEMCLGPVSHQLSELIRTAIVAAPGKRLIVSDYSAIEARVLAWLAGEQWRIDLFNNGGKIYEESAAKMYKCDVSEITKEDPRRQKGKVAELACGYQGGVGAILRMGGEEMGMTDEEMQMIVKLFRKENPRIVKFWYDLEDAAKMAIRTGVLIKVGKLGLAFKMKNGILHFLLPSGRCLRYPNAKLTTDKIGREKIVFWGVNQTSKKWERQDTYGGKLAENVTQAVARDCLANGLLNLHEAGYNIVMHVHDEAVCEEPFGRGSLEEMNELLCKKAPWMEGLPLKAAGFETLYYKKD